MEETTAREVVEALLLEAEGQRVQDIRLKQSLYDHLCGECFPYTPSEVYGVKIWPDPNLDDRVVQ